MKIIKIKPEISSEGFLINHSDWTQEWAIKTAEADQLILTQSHWEIINFVQKYYQEFKTSPGLRELIKALNTDSNKASKNLGQYTSISLFKLFPEGAAKQISRLAGLPKPKKCI